MRDHRKAEFRPVTERQKRLAQQLVDGAPIQTAMIEQGYSPHLAKQGARRIPKAVLRLMPKLAKSNLMTLGEMSSTEQETLVRGRLAYNTIVGQDKGVLSAKALGSDRRVNMFTPEVQSGVVVITTPLPALDEKAKILEAAQEE